MFDTADSMFSNILNTFYPDSPRLSLEDEAILILTNKLIEERYNNLSPEEQEAYSKAYKGVVEHVNKTRAVADKTESTEQEPVDTKAETSESTNS